MALSREGTLGEGSIRYSVPSFRKSAFTELMLMLCSLVPKVVAHGQLWNPKDKNNTVSVHETA